MGSMHTGLEDSGDEGYQKLATYFAERASGGVGMIMTGGIAPNPESNNPSHDSAMLYREDQVPLHRRVTDAVSVGITPPCLAVCCPWTTGTTRNTMFRIMKDIRFRNVFGKPIIISEFGAGAKKGYVSDKGPGMIWSEEYQKKVYEHQVDMLSRNDQVKGMSPWLLKDFRSGLRNLNGIQDIYNRKGLVSEKGEKKKAFYVLRDFYEQKAGD